MASWPRVGKMKKKPLAKLDNQPLPAQHIIAVVQPMLMEVGNSEHK